MQYSASLWFQYSRTLFPCGACIESFQSGDVAPAHSATAYEPRVSLCERKICHNFNGKMCLGTQKRPNLGWCHWGRWTQHWRRGVTFEMWNNQQMTWAARCLSLSLWLLPPQTIQAKKKEKRSLQLKNAGEDIGTEIRWIQDGLMNLITPKNMANMCSEEHDGYCNIFSPRQSSFISISSCHCVVSQRSNFVKRKGTITTGLRAGLISVQPEDIQLQCSAFSTAQHEGLFAFFYWIDIYFGACV